jgi:hypothetical protein
MSESEYPKPVGRVVSTLLEICRHQNRSELVGLLEQSHAHFVEIDYDNWNGGTRTWALRLEVPTVLYAAVQERRDRIEKELAEKLNYLDRQYPNDPLGEVTISPRSSDEMPLGQMMSPADADVRRLWTEGYLRLFVSHVSNYKTKVAQLKDALLLNGISAFVAHDDIEPSLEWPQELTLALRSMHSLAALFTQDFHDSRWTNQEIGWALGRGVPVIPIHLGLAPYGFVGKIQAVPGSLDKTPALASRITQALLRNRDTHTHMRHGIVRAFEQAGTFLHARNLKDIILTIEDFTEDEKDRLMKACKYNGQVSGSWGVVDEISRFVDSPPQVTARPNDDIPF